MLYGDVEISSGMSVWGAFTKSFVTACGSSKWNLMGVTVRPCRIWEVTSVVNKRVRHIGQTIQEFVYTPKKNMLKLHAIAC